MPSHQFEEIYDILSKNRNEESAILMKKYMKGRYEFFGIKSQERRYLLNTWLKNQNFTMDFQSALSIAKELMESDERETQYCALDLLQKFERKFSKHLEINDIHWMLEWIEIGNWWDIVDNVNTHLISHYFRKFPEIKSEMTLEWSTSPNIWIRRSSIIYQLPYKKETDIEILERNILNNMGSKEFFINKGIGWALREYSKTNPTYVIKFVEKNNNALHPLSKKEALRLLLK